MTHIPLQIALLVVLVSPAWGHPGSLDAYGCHSNKALYGTTAKRECHTDLLAGRVFSSLTAELKAFIAMIRSEGVVLLTWSANREPDLAGYRVYMGTVSGQYGVPTDVGRQTMWLVRHLTFGTRYYFVVTAVDTAGNESAFSAEVSQVVP